MKLKLIFYSFGLVLLLATAGAFGQAAVPPVEAAPDPASLQRSVQGSVAAAAPAPQGAPVSYASVSQLNGLLAELEAVSKTTQTDLTKLRIDRWKTDGSSKKRSLTDVDSIQRNLQGALPEIITQLRAAPEDLTPTFKLYRNLDTLDYVLGGVVESAGAFGSKDDLQSLSNDLEGFDKSRKAFADRMESLSASKEQELVRLRTDLKTAQAAIPAAPPKKIVVDDNEPKKPVVKKKPVAKKPAPAPGTTPATTPQPAQIPPAQPKQ